MTRIGGEVVVRCQFVDHRREQRVGKLKGTTAAPADGMMVQAMRLQRKLDGAGAHVGLDDVGGIALVADRGARIDREKTPLGAFLETEADIGARAEKLYQQTVVLKIMPPGNVTQMTDEERALIERWHRAR